MPKRPDETLRRTIEARVGAVVISEDDVSKFQVEVPDSEPNAFWFRCDFQTAKHVQPGQLVRLTVAVVWDEVDS
jgi:hypothetical protein